MYKSKLLLHPITVFVISILALGLSLFLYIYWYIEVSTGLESLVKKFNIDSRQVLNPQTWVVIMVLSILVALILVGIFLIFVYNQKTLQLYRLQHNFINNFTHELKTPVTSIKLYLETFIKHDLPREEQTRYLGFMIQDADRLSDNISRILELARIESKSYKVDFIRADIVDIIHQFLLKNRHLFKNCEISFYPPVPGSIFYPVNTSLFEMLLMNILTNAIKYNEANKPEIDIRFLLKDRKKLIIRFEDNGIGIQKSDIKKIFKKFYQAGQADNMTAKGSGIGLYLVQLIARLHKGRVNVESSGHGSIFTLVLPLSDWSRRIKKSGKALKSSIKESQIR